MARLILDLGARGRGHRQHDAARALSRRSSRTSRTARWSAACAVRCCCSARCSRGAAGRTLRRRAATFRRAARSTRTSRRSNRWARAGRRRRPRARGARRPEADVDLPLRSVGHRHRNGAARRRRRARASARSATPPASRTSSSCARSCEQLGVGITGAGTTTIRIEGGAKLRGAEHKLWGDYIEAGSWAVVAAVTGGEIDVHGARAEDMEVDRGGADAHEHRVRDRTATLFRVEQSTPARGRPHHHEPVAGLSERPGQPRHRARDAGGRADARPRLVIRAASVRARAVERHERAICSCAIRTGSSSPVRSKLRGRPLDSRDLRSGMALIAAALAADGQSRLSPLETVGARLRTAGRAAAGAGREGREDAVIAASCRPPGFLIGTARVRGVVRLGQLGRLRRFDRRQRQLGERRERIASDAERPQVGLGQIQHADDVRRQRQDDVGLCRRLRGVARTGGRRAAGRSARACPSSERRSSSRIKPGQHVRLAVAQPDDRVDLAVAERRQPAEPGPGDAA